mgnify:CR=1 FL=1
MVEAADFQQELRRLRAVPNVDYPGVAHAKLPVLRVLYEHFRRQHLAFDSERAQAFLAYRRERGEPLRLHALHDAIDEHLRGVDPGRYWGWPAWPEGLRDPGLPGVRDFERQNDESVQAARASLEADPAIQTLRRQFGATIFSESVRPNRNEES